MTFGRYVIGVVMVLLGVVFALLAFWQLGPDTHRFYAALAGIALAFVGGLIATSTDFTFQHKDWIFVFKPLEVPKGQVLKELPYELRRARRAYSATKRLPGAGAPSFKLLEDTIDLKIGPAADATVPSYLLDRAFRIVDWNDAFSLCFDRTMEGRRGMSVLEWTYFLDNYKEVLDHGVRAFSNEQHLPVIDVEEIRYTSDRYGPLSANKRAYQVPKDDGSCAGWLVILEIEFREPEKRMEFQRDLVGVLARDVMWSEYALSYDAVLLNSDVYPELLALMLGEDGHMDPIPAGARILDLGAGTGNLTLRLAQENMDRLVVAVENNRTMLALLRAKCQPYLRNDDAGGGVVALKQDITTLLGLEDEYFDHVIVNNVLYSLDDPLACLSEVYRVLRPGGEVRISGPKKSTRLDRVLNRIKSELQGKRLFDQLREDYTRLERINKMQLAPMLYRWELDDLGQMLGQVGFSEVVYSTDRAYASQSMVLCARK